MPSFGKAGLLSQGTAYRGLKRIAEARSYGDLSENSEYDAAKQEQAEVEAEIEEMQHRIEHAVVYVKESHYDHVKEGCTVTLLDMDANEGGNLFLCGHQRGGSA